MSSMQNTYSQPYRHSKPSSSAFSAPAKPTDDWKELTDLAERRRIQNRIAQRNYRKKIKRRLEDLEHKAKSSSVLPDKPDTQLSRLTEVHHTSQGPREPEDGYLPDFEVRGMVSKQTKSRAQKHTDLLNNPQHTQDMSRRQKIWTEITKDLVSEEALKTVGYDFEETNDFFYVLDHLRYDDVLRLVEVSEDLKRVRDESHLPDYEFEMTEEFRKSTGSLSSGISSRSRGSTKLTTVGSVVTSRSSSPESSSLNSPLDMVRSKRDDDFLHRAERGLMLGELNKTTNVPGYPNVRHHFDRLWCPERDCNASFSEEAQWRLHLNAAHEVAREPSCWRHGCNGRKFTTVDDLLEHQIQIRTADSNYQCLICGTKFPTENARDWHVSYEICLGRSEVPVLQISRPSSACRLCRERKVKCDGRLPSCTACTRRGVPSACSYQTNDPSQKNNPGNPLARRPSAGQTDRGITKSQAAFRARRLQAEVDGLEKSWKAPQDENNQLHISFEKLKSELESELEYYKKTIMDKDDTLAFFGTWKAADPSHDHHEKNGSNVDCREPISLSSNITGPSMPVMPVSQGSSASQDYHKLAEPPILINGFDSDEQSECMIEDTGAPQISHKLLEQSDEEKGRPQGQPSHIPATTGSEGKQSARTVLPGGLAITPVPKPSIPDRIKRYVEDWTQESWDWWPLRPCHRAVKPGLVRIQWHCASGHEHATNLCQADTTVLANEIERRSEQQMGDLLPQAHYAANTIIVASSTSSSSTESDGPHVGQSSASQSSSATSNGDTPDPPGDSSALDKANEPDGHETQPNNDLAVKIVPPSHLKGFVLFGVRGAKRLRRGKIRMAQINVEISKDDDSFFDEMRLQYKNLRGYMRWIFSIWCFRTCEFIMYHKANPNEIITGRSDIPSISNTDYLFNPTPDTAILKKVLATNFYGCRPACIKAHLDILCVLHECYGRNHCGKSRVLERLPRRRRQWEINRDDETDEAWGLNAVLGISFFKVFVYHLLIFAAPVGFWVFWVLRHPGDWQNASVPLFAAAVLLNLFWLPLGRRSEEKRSQVKTN